MKIAVTYENGNIFQHFGHTEEFKIYETDNKKIINSEIIGTDGHGHGALAGFLSSKKVDILICGGIGEGAKTALRNSGIRLLGGVQGSADRAVEELLAGTLSYSPDITCDHHEHENICGEHHCKNHSCENH